MFENFPEKLAEGLMKTITVFGKLPVLMEPLNISPLS
jgi:hypothetical protein